MAHSAPRSSPQLHTARPADADPIASMRRRRSLDEIGTLPPPRVDDPIPAPSPSDAGTVAAEVATGTTAATFTSTDATDCGTTGTADPVQAPHDDDRGCAVALPSLPTSGLAVGALGLLGLAGAAMGGGGQTSVFQASGRLAKADDHVSPTMPSEALGQDQRASAPVPSPAPAPAPTAPAPAPTVPEPASAPAADPAPAPVEVVAEPTPGQPTRDSAADQPTGEANPPAKGPSSGESDPSVPSMADQAPGTPPVDHEAPAAMAFDPAQFVRGANGQMLTRTNAFHLRGAEEGATVFVDYGYTVRADSPDGFSLPASVADGPMTLKVWQVDAAGNKSAVTSIDVVRDTTAPSVTIEGNGSPYSSEAHVTLHAVRSDRQVSSYDDLLAVSSTEHQARALDGTPMIFDTLADGMYRLYATDEVGNVSAVRQRSGGLNANAFGAPLYHLTDGQIDDFQWITNPRSTSAGNDYLQLSGPATVTWAAGDKGIDVIAHFFRSDHDVLDVSALLSGFDAGEEASFIQKSVDAAGDITLKIDATGAGDFSNPVQTIFLVQPADTVVNVRCAAGGGVLTL
jgi:hypothetical protein